MYDDLITRRIPPANRVGACEGGAEDHLSEGAVMLAFAMHLLRTVPDLQTVAIHPDGEHGKRFEFQSWLRLRDFRMIEGKGSTSYGGTYRDPTGRTLIVDPTSGHGDVEGNAGNHKYVAECKGGIINTKHPGQQSRLRKGLYEAVGLLLASAVEPGLMQFAVVPRTTSTEAVAKRLAVRARAAGIEIALVDGQGMVFAV